MTYYQLEDRKGFKDQFFSSLSLRFSGFTIVTWVELILRTSILPHIVWIDNHLLDSISVFSLIWCIFHVSIVTSFITWSILTNCFSLITRFLRKTEFNTIKAGKGKYQCWDHLRGRTNLNRLIVMEDIYQITKLGEIDVHTVQYRVKKIEHFSSVWLVAFHYSWQRKETVSKSITFRSIYNIYFIYFR